MSTRGIRNFNPFNIRRSQIVWLGERSELIDREFESFISMELGLRAGLLLLRNYIRRGYDTPRKILARFAPASENPMHDYLSYVCSQPLKPDQKIDFASMNFYLMCKRILFYESFYNVTVDKLSWIVDKYKLS